MTKKETITFQYEHCEECSNRSGPKYMKWTCSKTRRIIPDLWGDIPDWCPLEEVETVTVSLADMCMKHRKFGIQEVVEWLHLWHSDVEEMVEFKEALKEWGL